MQLVSLFSAQEIKPACAETNRFLNDRKHELHAWTETGELWIESLQIAIDGLPMKERVVDRDGAILDSHAVEPQQA